MEDQRRQIQRELNTTALGSAWSSATGRSSSPPISSMAGHSWPTGASHDQRAWVELIAYDADDNELFSSGVVEEGQPLVDLNDPQLWQLGDQAYDENGEKRTSFGTSQATTAFCCRHRTICTETDRRRSSTRTDP